MCVCVCVCACVRACVRACARVCLCIPVRIYRYPPVSGARGCTLRPCGVLSDCETASVVSVETKSRVSLSYTGYS